jgi:hypothetical protein
MVKMDIFPLRAPPHARHFQMDMPVSYAPTTNNGYFNTYTFHLQDTLTIGLGGFTLHAILTDHSFRCIYLSYILLWSAYISNGYICSSRYTHWQVTLFL